MVEVRIQLLDLPGLIVGTDLNFICPSALGLFFWLVLLVFGFILLSCDSLLLVFLSVLLLVVVVA